MNKAPEAPAAQEISDQENPLSQYIRTMASGRPLAEVLADILRDKIVQGDLLPGAKLIEAEVAKLYGVSRGPVREALRFLEREGLIEVEKHRSPVVRGVSPRMFAQMFEVRSVLEAFACNLAAQKIHGNPEDLAWAREEMLAWRSAKYAESVSTHISKNKELHARLIKIADHELLASKISGLIMPGYRATLETKLTGDEMERSAKQHTAVLEAVLLGDGDRAEKCMREHILASSMRVSQLFSAEYLDPRLHELRRLKQA